MRLFLVILLILQAWISYSQNLIIGESQYEESAIFQMHSTNQGFLLPRMDSIGISKISNPSVGLQVYSLSDSCLLMYDGHQWKVDYSTSRRQEYNNYPSEYKWDSISVFPGVPRSLAYSFLIGDNAYLIGGRDNTLSNLKDGYRYNLSTNEWSAIPDMPTSRYDGLSFTLGSKGYVGGGETEGSKYRIYSFDTHTEVWDSIADFPFINFNNIALAFVVNDTAYVGTEGYSFPISFRKYNSNDNTWSPIPDFPGVNRRKAVSFVINGKGCVGSGDTPSSNDFHCYNPSTNSWEAIAPIPLITPNQTYAYTIDNNAFVGDNDVLYTYSSNTNKWILLDDVPQVGSSNVTWSDDQDAYFTTGSYTVNNFSFYNSILFRKRGFQQTFSNNVLNHVEWSTSPLVKSIDTLTASSQNSFVSVPSGLQRSQILNVNVAVETTPNGSRIPAHFTDIPDVEYDYWLTGEGNIIVVNSVSNSSDILSKPVFIQITYRDE